MFFTRLLIYVCRGVREEIGEEALKGERVAGAAVEGTGQSRGEGALLAPCGCSRTRDVDKPLILYGKRWRFSTERV